MNTDLFLTPHIVRKFFVLVSAPGKSVKDPELNTGILRTLYCYEVHRVLFVS